MLVYISLPFFHLRSRQPLSLKCVTKWTVVVRLLPQVVSSVFTPTRLTPHLLSGRRHRKWIRDRSWYNSIDASGTETGTLDKRSGRRARRYPYAQCCACTVVLEASLDRSGNGTSVVADVDRCARRSSRLRWKKHARSTRNTCAKGYNAALLPIFALSPTGFS